MDYIYGKKRCDEGDSSDSKRQQTLPAGFPALPSFLPNQASNTSLSTTLPMTLPRPIIPSNPLSSSETPASSPSLMSSQSTNVEQSSGDNKPEADEQSKQNAPMKNTEQPTQSARKPKEIVPIQGTNIMLNTEEDIEEWIKQRKLNWMKRISNSRPIEQKNEQEETGSGTTTNNSNNNSRQKAQNNKQRGRDQNNRNQRNNNNPNNKQQNNQNQRNAPQQKRGITTVGPNVNLNNLILQREMKTENVEILRFVKQIFETGAYKVNSSTANEDSITTNQETEVPTADEASVEETDKL